MKKEDDLFVLIKSMTKAEKRHFKLSAGPNLKSNRAVSIDLFDFIDQQDQYDEEAIRIPLLIRYPPNTNNRRLAATHVYRADLASATARPQGRTRAPPRRRLRSARGPRAKMAWPLTAPAR